ncbi:hypothetical protein [Limisphaera sp. VF-2]|jgi:ABC-2 type transport system permease protein|uniref:hypothetical protein n=1 Tax=Limisphaera sp. VF-2 TaxID=3400418 RepID=UPI0017694C08|nr:hypothetical protein [Limisphaera sp.]
MSREQWKAVLWLRWRLLWRRLYREGPLAQFLHLFGTAMVLVGGLFFAVCGLAVGWLVLPHVTSTALMLVWDLVSFFFTFYLVLGVLLEVQKSEPFDLSRFLYLPLRVWDVFLLNFLATLVSPVALVFTSGLIGLALGLCLAHGPRMAPFLLLTVAYIVLVQAWLFALRGWLARLMMRDGRRRRAVLAYAGLSLLLVSQLPNLWVLGGRVAENASSRSAASVDAEGSPQPHPGGQSQRMREQGDSLFLNESAARALVPLHRWIPLLWPGYGAQAAARNEFGPVAVLLVATAGLAGLGLRWSWRSTLRAYLAEEPVRASLGRFRSRTSGGPQRRTWLERPLPWLPGPVAAVALAQLRSLTRAPEVRANTITHQLLLLGLVVLGLFRGRFSPDPELQPFLCAGLVAWFLFGTVLLLSNQFGLDRDGFRALMLCPAPRPAVLLGKNLGFFGLLFPFALAVLALVSWLLRFPPVVGAAGVALFAAGFLLLCVVGNLASILAPYHVSPGTLLPSRPPVVSRWLSLFLQLVVTPVALGVLFLPPLTATAWRRMGWPAEDAVLLLASLVLTGLAAGLYAILLPALGRMLHARQERILEAVTTRAE